MLLPRKKKFKAPANDTPLTSPTAISTMKIMKLSTAKALQSIMMSSMVGPLEHQMMLNY